MDDLFKQTEVVNSLLARYGVKFGIYKDGTFREQLFPFDPIPRVISKEEFDYLERGLRTSTGRSASSRTEWSRRSSCSRRPDS